MLKSEILTLRPLEPGDCELIYKWENSSELWEVSNTVLPFSKHLITEFINNSHNDIYVDRQVRFMITLSDSGDTVGCVDLFEFDPHHKRIGIGILIAENYDRGKGYASEALDLTIDFCFKHLGLHQMFCNILESNHISRKLFESNGFELVGVKKDWINYMSEWQNEMLYQLINPYYRK